MGMIVEIAKSIFGNYNTDMELRAVLTGGMYYQHAKDNAVMPYGVFSLIGIGQLELMGGTLATNNLTDCQVQFDLYSKLADGGVKMADITEKLWTAYNWKTLVVTGYNLIKMQHLSTQPDMITDEIRQVTVLYEMEIQKS